MAGTVRPRARGSTVDPTPEECESSPMFRRIDTRASQFARHVSLCVTLIASAHAQLGVTLSPPKLVNSNGTSDTTSDNHCALATDSNTRFVCVFATTDPTLTNGGDSDIAVTRTHDGGTTWKPTTLLYATMA